MVDIDKAVQKQVENIQNKTWVRISSANEVDAELVGWIKAACEAAG